MIGRLPQLAAVGQEVTARPARSGRPGPIRATGARMAILRLFPLQAAEAIRVMGDSQSFSDLIDWTSVYLVAVPAQPSDR